MLEVSEALLKKASPSDMQAAEIVAHRYLVCELIENLIPPQEAERIINAHKNEADETWRRAVHGALQSLHALETQGIAW